MAFGLLEATLVTAFVNSTLYGFFLCLYAILNYILFRRRKTKKLSIPLLTVAFAMFCFATLSVVDNNVYRLLTAFLSSSQSDAISFLEVLANPSNCISTTTYVGQTLLGDGFLIYRLFILWRNNPLVTYPFLLCYFGCAAAGIGSVYEFATSDGAVFDSKFVRWSLPFAILSLITNLMCTSLIAAKIWFIHRKTARYALDQGDETTLVTPMILIIESGAIYSICLIIQITLYLSGSLAAYIVTESIASIIGITFLLIIVRLGLGVSAAGKDTNDRAPNNTRTLSFGIPSTVRTEDFATSLSNVARSGSGRGVRLCEVCQPSGGDAMPMRPLEVRLPRIHDIGPLEMDGRNPERVDKLDEHRAQF